MAQQAVHGLFYIPAPSALGHALLAHADAQNAIHMLRIQAVKAAIGLRTSHDVLALTC